MFFSTELPLKNGNFKKQQDFVALSERGVYKM